ncbi:hypothetical protein N7499_003139 [Penicillium canescens]|uniref:Uncharacterized protein n=1 Tax=Penicillium canescens TaxID=5083 RepID=A0AAD6N815_PENCN|nr:uncharacterized protein N7446_012008 [Penicillium canescens]KAJ6019768.1 hypothetical protein N7522_000476 [Penicillium canescens]KAJ6039054.1 hypothetical protein N7460_007086 [Penicillium canescens]KAJ6047174.1 hypothetical protein N7446_012008 [Penicillium canescens]KAJ6060058.1 hypothetical protein N7444_002804 [Penicillium canescens]KAJ6093808.1 hypothetical protein N7499_003139 [Penicillium canescens]
MNEILSRGLEDERHSGPTSKRSSFILVHHYIGRLAHHIRATKELHRDTKDLSHLLDSYAVCKIPAPSAVPPPIRDSHTNLRGILNRMFKHDDHEREMLEDGLLHLNKVAGIFENFLRQYDGSLLEVHAEIRLLEYFHKSQRSFAGEDRFIACSKPACLCCEMYFKYHPARVMVSSSHRKIWTKWSPPLVQHFNDESPAARQQKYILNKMTKDLREQVAIHILQHLPSKRWHPDSITNITDIRRFGISSDLPEVSGIESPETHPSTCTQVHQNRFNSPLEAEFSDTLVQKRTLMKVFVRKMGGFSFWQYLK